MHKYSFRVQINEIILVKRLHKNFKLNGERNFQFTAFLLQAVGPDHPAEHFGHEKPARDPLGPGEHRRLHADRAGRGDARLGDQSGAGGDVSMQERLP